MSNEFTRITLIEKIKENYSESSWDEFISLYKGYVFMILKKMNFGIDDCNDILQSVFVKVWKSVKNFDHQGRVGQFRKWLTLITRNTALTFIRDNNKKIDQHSLSYEDKEIFIEAITESEIDLIAEQEWAVYISNIAWDNLRDNMNEIHREVFKMSMDGCSRNDIAEKLVIPPNTVSVYKRRAVNLLKREIERLQKEFG